MPEIEAKLEQMGLKMAEPFQTPPGVVIPFSWVVVRGNHVYISGHIPTNQDGSVAEPLGKVGAEVTVEQGYEAAKLIALGVLGDLKRAIGDLDRVTGWGRVLGMVNVAPGFNQTTAVVIGFSDLILSLYGPERGAHSRSAVGMAALPVDAPVEIEAECDFE